MHYDKTTYYPAAVYPGNYTPVLTEEQVRLELDKYPHQRLLYTNVSLTEFTESFKLEITVPGIAKEDLLIVADDNDLCILVMHKNSATADKGYTCFDQHITLPGNADAEFSSAAFSAGILQLHIHKAKSPVKNVHVNIAVY
jgi:HSP20 family molecular chaperone IbpA